MFVCQTKIAKGNAKTQAEFLKQLLLAYPQSKFNVKLLFYTIGSLAVMDELIDELGEIKCETQSYYDELFGIYGRYKGIPIEEIEKCE